MNKDVTTDEPSLTIIYDYSVNEYCKITKRAKIGTHQNIEKTYMGSVEEINSIKAFCKKKNLCVHCGGKFKGIFNKVCSKCGNPQDY